MCVCTLMYDDDGYVTCRHKRAFIFLYLSKVSVVFEVCVIGCDVCVWK